MMELEFMFGIYFFYVFFFNPILYFSHLDLLFIPFYLITNSIIN
jgi:hypothetical protein